MPLWAQDGILFIQHVFEEQKYQGLGVERVLECVWNHE